MVKLSRLQALVDLFTSGMTSSFPDNKLSPKGIKFSQRTKSCSETDKIGWWWRRCSKFCSSGDLSFARIETQECCSIIGCSSYREKTYTGFWILQFGFETILRDSRKNITSRNIKSVLSAAQGVGILSLKISFTSRSETTKSSGPRKSSQTRRFRARKVSWTLKYFLK